MEIRAVPTIGVGDGVCVSVLFPIFETPCFKPSQHTTKRQVQTST